MLSASIHIENEEAQYSRNSKRGDFNTIVGSFGIQSVGMPKFEHH